MLDRTLTTPNICAPRLTVQKLKELSEFVALLDKEQEEISSEESFIFSLHKEQNADSSDE